MFAIFILIIQVIIFLGHFVIYKVFVTHVAPVLTSKYVSLNVVRVFFAIMSLTFIAGSVLTYRSYSEVGKVLYQFSAVWLGTVWFLFIAAVLIALFRLSPLPSLIIFIIALLISFGSVVNSFIVHVKPVEITEADMPNMPEAWKGKKAIFLADTHIGNMRNKAYLERLTNQIIAEKPDIVFISGDLFDGPPVPYEDSISPLRKITDPSVVPLGVYYVTGNHEEFGSPDVFVNAIKSVGIHVLNNETTDVLGMTIAGADYGTTKSRDDYQKVLSQMFAGVDMNKPIILLKHVPSNIDVAEAAGVDLSLYGHTHNGQMWPLNLIARKAFKGFEYGFKKSGAMSVITTSGAGSWGPPQRFLTQSEIVEITFK